MIFDFFPLPKILFGCNAISRIDQLVPTKNLFIIYNGSPEPLKAVFPNATVLHQKGEPTVGDIERAVSIAREQGANCILALGGGSAIDAAKATAAILANGGSPTDYMEVVGAGQKITKPAIPWIAIPTTAGTGAEVTRNAVIGWPEKKFKASIRSELILPRAVIIDPQLHVATPPDVTARSGMDALCQCIEAYTSKNANPITDALALKGTALAAQNLRITFTSPEDLSARQNMALAALLSGIALTNAGLGAVHGFASPLGANLPIPHGTICGVLLPHVIEANTQAAHADLAARYAQLGRAMANDNSPSDQDAIQACINITRDLIRDLHLPSLAQFGLNDAEIPKLVALAKKSSSMKYNPVDLSDAALAQILKRAL